MSDYSIFDIIGPVMIGPSSSHTAGACKIGKLARQIAGERAKRVRFFLHGSFGETFKGHGTDRALVAGVLGIGPGDERLKRSFGIAKKGGVKFSFEKITLHNVHPNTVRIEIETASGKKHVIAGSSISGGKVKIVEIDGIPVDFDGDYTTLITRHLDRPGIVAKISAILAKHNLNIAFMELFRQKRGQEASIILSTDGNIPEELLSLIRRIPEVKKAEVISAGI